MGVSRGAAPSCLFVYGTLRRSFNNTYACRLAQQGEWLGEARVAGKLYNLGHYPGMKLASSDEQAWVVGELYRLPDDPESAARLLAELDDYEAEEFERVAAVVEAVGEVPVQVWIYEYSVPVDEALRIRSGDYLRQ